MRNPILVVLVMALLVTNAFFYMQNVQLRVELDDTIAELQTDQVEDEPVFRVQSDSDSASVSAQREIPVVAVSSEGQGVLGKVNLRLVPGESNVLVDTKPFLEADLQYSANQAITVAKEVVETGEGNDFIVDFDAEESDLLGGESAGAAMTVLTIAALENKSIKNDTVITGTINADGTIGQVGGIYEKAMAVSQAGFKTFLVPKGQSVMTYYDRDYYRDSFGLRRVRIEPVKVDIKAVAEDEWGLDIVEVETIGDALPYLLA